MAGFLSLGLVFAASRSMREQQRRVADAQKLAHMAEATAEERSFLLQEMKHRIQNHIARIQSIARMTERESTDLAEFTTRFGNRLTAMAVAQDLATGAASAGVSLHQVLSSELKQQFSDERVAQMLDGPEIPLSERQSHTLCLVFHELMTNGMKHGALAENDDNLSVTWVLGNDEVVLTWAEKTASATASKVGTGFGSRLLDVCVRGESKGTITRSIDDSELHITIRFPVSPALGN